MSSPKRKALGPGLRTERKLLDACCLGHLLSLWMVGRGLRAALRHEVVLKGRVRRGTGLGGGLWSEDRLRIRQVRAQPWLLHSLSWASSPISLPTRFPRGKWVNYLRTRFPQGTSFRTRGAASHPYVLYDQGLQPVAQGRCPSGAGGRGPRFSAFASSGLLWPPLASLRANLT